MCTWWVNNIRQMARTEDIHSYTGGVRSLTAAAPSPPSLDLRASARYWPSQRVESARCLCKAGFLNAGVGEDIFVKVAPGYEIADKYGVPSFGTESQEEFIRPPAESRRVGSARWTISPPQSSSALSRRTRGFTYWRTLTSPFFRSWWTSFFLLSGNERVLKRLN